MTTRFDALPIPQQAGILCGDTRFQKFAAEQCGFQGGQLTTEAAAEYLRRTCKIASRRELKSNSYAQDRFNRLQTEFDAWTGKIANQR